MTDTGVPHICFYGDDFTGSSENLAQYHRHGLRCLLFFDSSSIDRIRNHLPDLDVIGIAGVARSLSPKQMVDEVQPALAFFREVGSPIIQYKICSTFDSSPEVGNFACPIRLARALWPQCFIPVLAATPDFGRYTVFGNHFARHGQVVYRLDRNPSMVNHPSTPMREADLREHLARQTGSAAGLVDVRALDGGPEVARRALADYTVPTVFDTITNEHLLVSARLIGEIAERRPVFALAAQGLAHGLGQYLASRGLVRARQGQPAAHPVGRIVVLSGSCALQTTQQIRYAEEHGWATVTLDVVRLLRSCAEAEAVMDDCCRELEQRFAQGRDVIVCTAKAPIEETMRSARRAMRERNLSPDQVSLRIGRTFARITERLLAKTDLRRMIFAGGDTSSYAMRHLDAYALGIERSDLRQSSHLCRLFSKNADIDGLQVVLKGGQVGDDDLFLKIKAGLP